MLTVVILCITLSILWAYTNSVQRTTLAIGRLVADVPENEPGTGIQDAITPSSQNVRNILVFCVGFLTVLIISYTYRWYHSIWILFLCNAGSVAFQSIPCIRPGNRRIIAAIVSALNRRRRAYTMGEDILRAQAIEMVLVRMELLTIKQVQAEANRGGLFERQKQKRRIGENQTFISTSPAKVSKQPSLAARSRLISALRWFGYSWISIIVAIVLAFHFLAVIKGGPLLSVDKEIIASEHILGFIWLNLVTSVIFSFPALIALLIAERLEKKTIAKTSQVKKNNFGQPMKASLLKAAEEGDVQSIQSLLKQGVGINARDAIGRTALMAAADRNRIEACRFLLSEGANVNAKAKGGLTALHMAASNGFTEIVQLLLSLGARINAKCEDGTTALMLAASYGHCEALTILLDKKAHLNLKQESGDTALMLAATDGRTEAVRLLLERRAETGVADDGGLTALALAAGNGHFESVRLLLEKVYSQKRKKRASTNSAEDEIDIEKILSRDLTTHEHLPQELDAALLAATNGHINVLNFLIERGATVTPNGNDIGPVLLKIAGRGKVEEPK